MTRLHCVHEVASASRGAIDDYNDWLEVVTNPDMNSESKYALPPCPMEIVAEPLYKIEAGHRAVRLTQVWATLLDLRLADLKAYHQEKGTILESQWVREPRYRFASTNACQLYYDLLTAPLNYAPVRLDGMKASTISQILAESQAKSVHWTVGQVVLFIGARWAWDLDATAGGISPNLRDLPNPLRPKPSAPEWDDAKTRYIYELAQYHDKGLITYRPPCKPSKASRIPFSLRHPIFSVTKCVTWVCSGKSCNKTFLLGPTAASPPATMEGLVKMEPED